MAGHRRQLKSGGEARGERGEKETEERKRHVTKSSNTNFDFEFSRLLSLILPPHLPPHFSRSPLSSFCVLSLHKVLPSSGSRSTCSLRRRRCPSCKSCLPLLPRTNLCHVTHSLSASPGPRRLWLSAVSVHPALHGSYVVTALLTLVVVASLPFLLLALAFHDICRDNRWREVACVSL